MDETMGLIRRFTARGVRGTQAQDIAYILFGHSLHRTSQVLSIIEQENPDAHMRSLLAERLAILLSQLDSSELDEVLPIMRSCYVTIRGGISENRTEEDGIELLMAAVSAVLALKEQNPYGSLIPLSQVVTAALSADNHEGDVLEDGEETIAITSSSDLRVLSSDFLEFLSLHPTHVPTISNLLSNGLTRIAELQERVAYPASVSVGAL